ncbi:MAG: thermonuclease family protein [Erythrobacter sp.]
MHYPSHPLLQSQPFSLIFGRLFGLFAASVLVILAAIPLGAQHAWAQTQTQPASGAGSAAGQDTQQAYFPICSGARRVTCVVDGDTIWLRGTKIRIADIDTPEVSRPACPREAQLGARATQRLQALLNLGPFSLAPNPSGRTTDRYGRSLMVLMRGGASLGQHLVREGLAHRWNGARRGWC